MILFDLYDICHPFSTVVAICTSLGFLAEELPFFWAMYCFFKHVWIFVILDDLYVLIVTGKKHGKSLMPSRVATKNLSEHF